MVRALVVAGSVLGLLGVAAGAFGAHALRTRLTAERALSWKTASDYQLWHALATVAAGLAAGRWGSGAAAAAGWCFVAGVVMFSGSLFAMAATGSRAWGKVTPIGGVAFMAGWALLAVSAVAA